MKMKHNKKRNTAFLFETLVSELTKSVVHNDAEKRATTKNLICKYFRRGTNLYEELQLYKALLETRGLEPIVAEKLIFEVKTQRKCIMDTEIFKEQSDLIGDMNKEYGKSAFANFVPNYKDLATLAQLFNTNVSVKERVLLESKIIETLTSPEDAQQEKMVPIDNLVYKTFVEKFNEKYGDTLEEHQKALLGRYITSFADNGVELKLFLNEEIGRLKRGILESLDSEELKGDPKMAESAKRVLEELQSYSAKEIDEDMIRSVLKIQQLTKELHT